MADGVISHEEVLRHVYHFLRAYGYKNTLLALQNESRVPYNTIDVVEGDEESDRGGSVMPVGPAELEKVVLEGKWDIVLSTYIDTLLLPEEIMFDLYEHIFEELLTLHQFVHAARAFFVNSPIFASMKQTSVARYARLQQLLERYRSTLPENTNLTTKGPIPLAIKEKRESLLKVLKEAITWNSKQYNGVLPMALWRLQNSELETSITAENISLKRKREDSMDGDVKPPSTMFLHYPLQCPQNIREKVVFADATMPTSSVVTSMWCAENKNNEFTAIIVGKTDGTVDFLDGDSAQPFGKSIKHTDGVLSVTLDAVPEESSVWVAVGYRDGWVKIYDTETRKLLRRFSKVHGSGVTSLLFAGARSSALSGHRSQVVSGSYDGTIQVLDIPEGKSVQSIVDAHQSKYVLSMCVVSRKREELDGIVSAGNNGTLCFWTISVEGMRQAGPARALRSIHASLKEDEEMPTRLIPVEEKDSSGEFIVLTRGHRVLLLSAHFTGNSAEPLIVVLHAVISAPRPLYGGCLQVLHSPALAVPMLSLFLTDRKGGLLLYNVEMSWRLVESENARMSGAQVELRPTDESFVVAVSHGLVVEDLNVASIHSQSNSLLAYSPSLSTMYILSWC